MHADDVKKQHSKSRKIRQTRGQQARKEAENKANDEASACSEFNPPNLSDVFRPSVRASKGSDEPPFRAKPKGSLSNVVWVRKRWSFC